MRLLFPIVFLALSFTTARAQVLFSDDFTRGSDPGPLSPWIVYSGNFSVTGGAFKAGPNTLDSFAFAYVTNSWTNYLVQARVRFSTLAADGGGIGGRLNPASGAHYAAWIAPENSPAGARTLELVKFQDWRVYEYSNSMWQKLQLVTLPSVGTNWHTLGLGFQGNQISVYYDSNLVASAIDQESNPFPYGGPVVSASTANNTAYSMFVDDLSVSLLPQPLQSVNDLYITPQNNALTVPAPGVLSNDLAGPNPNLSATKISDPSHGTVSLNSNGGFTYTPANNFVGIDTFSYRLSDGITNTGVTTVSIDVNPSTSSFFDNFTRTANSNAFCPWITGTGEWAVTNAQMLGRGTIDDNYSDCYVPLVWSDISVQTKFQLPSNAWACGINARTDPRTGARYVLNIYPENSGLGPPRTLRVIKFHDWEDWNADYVSMAVVTGLPTIGTSVHTLRGDFYGNKIDVYLDGNRICSVTDTNVDGLPPFRTGCAGVHMYFNPEYTATFDDFSITALPPVNTAPTLPTLPNITTTALQLMTVTNTATDLDPSNTLSYALQTAPAGASIDANGIITWTPTAQQNLTTNLFRTVVTDFYPGATNSQHLTATNTFQVVVVGGTNALPIVNLISTSLAQEGCSPPNQAVDAGETVTMLVALRNAGPGAVTNLIATLQNTSGVLPVTTAQPYGLMPAGGPVVTQAFTFIATASCGATIQPTLFLSDDSAPVGTVTYSVPVGAVSIILTQNFDGVTAPALPAGWATATSGAQPNWVTTAAAASTPPNSAFSADATAVGINTLTSPAFFLPNQSAQLAFTHYYDLEADPNIATNGWDGGVLEIQVGTNAFTDILVAGGSFVSNGYNRVIDTLYQNPLAGRRAWSGNSGGFITTIVNLPATAIGKTNQVRWRCGTDNGNGTTGWRLDSIAVSGTFCCSNTAGPVLTSQPNRTIPELALMTVTNSATEANPPPGGFNYSLLNPPAGASIDANGVITWTPTEAQGPSTNTIITLVSDNGVPPLSASNSFQVVVTELNSAPALPPQTNRAIAELTLLTVTNTATSSDVPPNTLAYSLLNPPSGASVSTNGVITWTPTEAQGPGTNTITTVVTDNGAPPLSATNSFQVVVTEVNSAPVLPAQTNRTIAEGTLLSVTNAATDPDLPANALNYSLLNAPVGANISAAGVITWTPTESQGPSTNTITTVAVDNGVPSLSATNSFQVVVTEVNSAPLLAAQTNHTIAEGTLLSVTNAATDPDLPANALNYSLLNAPVGANISAAGVITWTPTESQGPSTNTITTVAVDNGVPSLSATNSFQVVVTEVNSAPVLAAQTNHTIAEGTLLSVTNAATDPDLPANALNYSLLNAPVGANISAAGVITWTPTESQGPSTNTITTVAVDNGVPSLSATNSFQVVVTEVNNAPVLPAQTNHTIAEGTLLSVTNAATDPDLPANALNYSLLNAPVGANISAAGVITWTPTESQGPSTNTITTVVTDDGVPPLSATNSFQVVVTEVNNAPVLSAQTNHTIAEGTSLTVTNVATDSDIPANTLAYSLLNPPAGASISTNGVITWTPTEAEGPSTNTITTVVTDDGVPPLSATNSFQVVVTEVNNAPVLPAQTAHTIAEGTSLTVTNAAIDSDVPANTLAYSLLNPPAGANISATGVISWTPTEAQGPSTNTITTVVADNGVPPLSATNSFQVVVTEVNTTPVLLAQTNHTIAEGTFLSVTNAATDSDLPANTLSYSLLNPPVGASISTNGVITWTPTEAQGPSTNTITTVVTDDGIPPLSATNSFQVVVTEVNTAPVLPTQSNHTIAEGTLLSVTNAATDSDVPANTITYSLLNAPAGASISAAGVITWTPTEAQGPSTNIITTVVTDDGVPPLSATNSFEVVVTEVNTAPVFPAQTNHSIAEGTLLSVMNAATDSDIPANTLTYSLLNAPTGANISAAGVITWTPTQTEGPSTNTITTVVTDDGAPPLSATNSFQVVVTEVNTAPVLPSQTNHTIAEGTLLTVTNAATDSDVPANTLTYSLLNAPAGASISAAGVITWIPTEAEGPSTNTITSVVTDDGVPPLSATNTFEVVVTEVNSAPVLPALTNVTIAEGTLLMVTNTASDSDLPANILSYSLVNPPAGMTINAEGVITWTPNESQGPATNTITTIVTDDGVPPLSATNSIEVMVRELNSAPELSIQTNQMIIGLGSIAVTNAASDADLPVNAVGYELVSAPTNATIDLNGVITWSSTLADVPSTNLFVTIATDYSPEAINETHLTATNSFLVIVQEPPAPGPVIRSLICSNNLAKLAWDAVPCRKYAVEYTEDFLNGPWQPLSQPVQAATNEVQISASMGESTQRFYRVVLLP